MTRQPTHTPPDPDPGPSVQTTLSLPLSLRRKIDAIAHRSRMSRSATMLLLIEQALASGRKAGGR